MFKKKTNRSYLILFMIKSKLYKNLKKENNLD